MHPAREAIRVCSPPAALQEGIVCAILRTVAAGAPLEATVHAQPYACLNVIVDGEVRVDGQPLPRRFLAGPCALPLRTTVPREVRSLSLVFQPWLLPAVSGRRAQDLEHRLVAVPAPTHPLLDTWCALAEAACTGGDGAAFWAGLQAAWPRPAPAAPALALAVLRGEGVAVAAAHLHCSERQYRRRFRQHMGLNPARWLRLARWEEALRGLVGAAPRIGELAAGAGYADQAHLTRDTRAIAGHPPARLQQLLQEGAGCWSLRPALVRSVQDGG